MMTRYLLQTSALAALLAGGAQAATPDPEPQDRPAPSSSDTVTGDDSGLDGLRTRCLAKVRRDVKRVAVWVG